MKRRNFLQLAAAGAAALAIAPKALFAETIPTLYGDGVHDDTKALQAWLDRDVEHCSLEGKSFLISDTLYTGCREYYHEIRHCEFITSDNFRGAYMIDGTASSVEGGHPTGFLYCDFRTKLAGVCCFRLSGWEDAPSNSSFRWA